MKRKPRIYYSDSQKALMWGRWRQGDSLQNIAQLFDRNHSSVERILAETGKECMDYNEMLFAVKVNEMAQALQTGTMPHELHTGPVPELVQWLRENPAERFIPQILAQLKNTAQLIREIEGQSESESES